MKKMLNYYLKTYFGFSRRESKGFVLVVPALVILYLFPTVYDNWITSKHKDLYIEYQQLVDSLLQEGWQLQESPSLKLSGQDSSKSANHIRSNRQVSLNQLNFTEADSIVLQVVPGIGPTMAGRIVKFREQAGGIYDKDQLFDVYGMTPEVLDRIFDYFYFEPSIERKLAINVAEVQELAKHPYINYGAAKVIVAYREQHGAFRSPEDLLKIKIFNQDWVDRLEPYLSF